jgi:hypothetical protein
MLIFTYPSPFNLYSQLFATGVMTTLVRVISGGPIKSLKNACFDSQPIGPGDTISYVFGGILMAISNTLIERALSYKSHDHTGFLSQSANQNDRGGGENQAS